MKKLAHIKWDVIIPSSLRLLLKVWIWYRCHISHSQVSPSVYTNQSETVNSMLSVKKISWLKKFPRKKSHFVKYVWKIIADHQSLENERTLTNESAEYHLSEESQYLAIPTEVWYQWPYEDRMEYIKFLRSLGKKTI